MKWTLVKVSLYPCSQCAIPMEITKPFAIFMVYEPIFDILIYKKESI